MKKDLYLFIIAMCLATTASWASPVTGNASFKGANGEPAVITANVEAIDFGDVVIGYNVYKTFMVFGTNLTEDMTLSISDDRFDQFSVSPSTLTPEKAAMGMLIRVTLSPYNPYGETATLTISSPGAEDVVIPITSTIYRATQMPKFNEMSAYVGWFSSISGTVNIPDAEIPHDPNTPVVRTPAAGNDPVSQVAPGEGMGYFYTISGDNCFSVVITRSSSIAKTCDVKIIYRPLTLGTHNATITFSHIRGGCSVTVNVTGTAIEQPQAGDLNGDGLFSIGDATGLIDLLLSDDEVPPFADVDCDNAVSIKDVTTLIDMLLGGQ